MAIIKKKQGVRIGMVVLRSSDTFVEKLTSTKRVILEGKVICGLNESKIYFYKTTDNTLEVGDRVVIPTRDCYSVGTFVGYAPLSHQCKGELKYIVGKVNLEEYYELVIKNKKIEALKLQMNKRKEELEDINMYELMAKSDPDMAEMLKEYKKLKENI